MDILNPDLDLKKVNILWIDFMANGIKLSDEKEQWKLVQNTKESKISHVVIDAKIPYGLTTYPSYFSPHVSSWEDQKFKEWEDRDFLDELSSKFINTDIKVLANLNVFSEGLSSSKIGKVYENPDWQVTYYNSKLTNESNAMEYSDAETIFVNPILSKVIEHELNIIKEVCSYSIDGIVLDRCRYPNVYADFSDISRKHFENFIEEKIVNWPEDIYRIDENKEIHFGKLFSKWIEWRALNIKRFVSKARKVVKKHNSNYLFANYVGSWYPLYYNEGLNWASETYEPEIEWATDTYKNSGLAEQLDFIMTGCYYPEVTIEEAKKNNRPEDWYSVEGGANISLEVINNKIPVISSLYLKDYENNPKQFIEAIRMSKIKTGGMMLFDLSHLEKYSWWDLLKEEMNEY